MRKKFHICALVKSETSLERSVKGERKFMMVLNFNGLLII